MATELKNPAASTSRAQESAQGRICLLARYVPRGGVRSPV
jgi:hypothetical protein